jgi:4-amino-4-deoxy-L-arabinose transferase-like glycosyltransferase
MTPTKPRDHALAHVALLVLVTALLTLPNLGGPALWDMDEGINAASAREMLEAGTWVVPTFNWKLRTDKPIMIDWVQVVSFKAFGVSEWAARLPAALFGFGSVLTTYWLGRRMFDPAIALLGGLILASSIQFQVQCHAATPDAPFIFFVALTLALVWRGQENGGRGWFVAPAVPCAFAVLTKGPAGLIVPGAAILAFFLWNREGRRILDWHFPLGVLVYGAVALPWYAFITAETRGVWLYEFIGRDNLDRVVHPQESHAGPVYYYVVCLIVFFAPWSCVIAATLWHAARGTRRAADGTLPGPARAARLLLAWCVAFFVPFSLVATKLPNYVAPLYPPLALVTAWFLMSYVRRAVAVPRWVMLVAAGGVLLTGVAVAAGLLLASGVVPLDVRGMRVFPGLENWAWVGGVPALASAVMAWAVLADRRPAFVAALTASAVVMVGVLAAFAVFPVDARKAPKALVRDGGAYRPDEEVRLATYRYSTDNESIVFYAERRVEPLAAAEDARTFLATLLPVYLFVPEAVWQAEFEGRPDTPPYRVTARKYDYLKNGIILTVTNQ